MMNDQEQEAYKHIRATLNEASELVAGDRAQTYGDPVESYERVASASTALLGKPLTAHDIAVVLTVTKLARTRIDNKHRDSHVDGAAYLAIALACADREAGREESSLAEQAVS